MSHFQDQLDQLKAKLLQMSTLAQETVEATAQSLIRHDAELAEQVFEKERFFNRYEIEIDEMGHNLLALGQPVATDLRWVTTILKINTDLERIADHCVNIAERVILLLEQEEKWEWDSRLTAMALDVQDILKDALHAFHHEDVALAQKVLRRDDEVDHYNDDLYADVESLMQRTPALIPTGMKLVRIAHDLERIGDLANNIAEDVIYLKLGKEVRHRIKQ